MDQLILNPGNCKGVVSYETRSSALLSALGGSPVFSLRFIRRNVSATARSPWLVRNLNSQYERLCLDISEQEAQKVRQLESNPLPEVLILDNGKFVKRCYSGSLAELLSSRYSRRQGPLETWKSKIVATRMLDALVYLHTFHRIVHGDICSHNVLVNETFSNIRLCGFEVTPEGTVGGKTVAIGLWTAPEMLDRKVTKSVESDVFSFGMVVYEMLTSMPPHTFPGIRTVNIPEPGVVIDTRNFAIARKIGMSLTWKLRPFARMSTAPLPRHLLPANRCPNSFKNKLNYACLGTRPLIPHAAALNENYNDLIALFYTATEPNFKIRPSSSRLLAAWKKLG